MSARQLIWLPSWVSNEVRQGLTSDNGCHCSTFCEYFRQGGRGVRPTVGNLCPLYFRDRPVAFTAFSGTQAVIFIDRAPAARDSLFVGFDEEKVTFQFGRGPIGSATRVLETFGVYRDQRPVAYLVDPITSPYGDLSSVGSADLLRVLENYLEYFVVLDSNLLR